MISDHGSLTCHPVATKKGKMAKWILTGIGLLGFFTWALWPVYHLEVKCLSRPEGSLHFPLSSGDRFSIWFLHSYDRAFFQENYQIDAHHQIFLRDMVFKSHLNGGGFSYPNFRLREDGVGELKEINEQRNQVEFMMGSKDLANHTLLWNGKKIELSDFFQAGEIITLRVVEQTGWKKIWQVIVRNGGRRLIL
jgi:hypothetical protein